MKTRAFLAALAAGALLGVPALAQQAYPSKPVRLIIPFGAGGATDVMGRVLAEELRGELGQSIVVENVTGASGIIGAHRVARAPADGYTLLFTTNVQVINPAIRKVPFDAVKDFTPIALIGYVPNILVVKADAPYRTYQDYVAAAKADPGGITFATPGVGTSTHFAGEQLGYLTGTRYTNVPYNSTTAMAQSVLAGDVKSTWLPGQVAEPYIRAGQLRALGVASEKRSVFLPDTPTFRELGLQGLVSETWWALFAPAGLAAPIAKQLVDAMSNVMSRPAVQEKMRQAGLDRAAPLMGEPVRALMAEDLKLYRDIVHAAKIPQLD
ncbi:Bug family tripartite tricarboxylate transporter substrate binding protein [Pseudorhodoferax sp.]|uniref:Bug family tripartite tricarboxylate transporter substrate binding protein n=1 Tax=Pseudorhodoferax sp. TaxID=1993553 RepID=UPI0039E5228F